MKRKPVVDLVVSREKEIASKDAEILQLRLALREAVKCVGEFVDVHGTEWHDGTPLNDKYEQWEAILLRKDRFQAIVFPEQEHIAAEILSAMAEETVVTQIADFGFGRTREEAIEIWRNVKKSS